ncbi:DUF1826 domain-containing protein [Cobetia sp. 14N.309.X.WAT.E.A4]|uniref:DUF1826 domain-containing protein n=1 Tax=Cobetia TaxID=204286 RepID=UPI0025AF62DA|nr:DUF1826 domain-containing protein [Cobetia sp. 14N.309.X.WAT.E.A4]MDN2655958.1 DUF1826 domain-containing protein [Cobetia sp. 14N.309.X.WAT.E.A4]
MHSITPITPITSHDTPSASRPAKGGRLAQSAVTASGSKDSATPHWHIGEQALDLGEIFRPEVTLAVMQRRIDAALKMAVKAQSSGAYPLRMRWRGPINDLREALERYLPAPDAGAALIEDIYVLGEAIGELFDVQDIGMRLEMTQSAMCPRFHVDRIPVRLVTTYEGPGTQWLPEQAADRLALGHGVAGHRDICRDPEQIRELRPGSLALLKGECWPGNEGHGLIHRSPVVPTGSRLMLSMDPG